jgi:uncharacterized protein (TIGR02058 family)
MALKTYAIEYGLGIDLHGQDATKAAIRAVRNAVERVSLPGMRQIVGVTDLQNEVFVEINLGVPADYMGMVDVEKVKAALPFGQRTVRVSSGGLLTSSGSVIDWLGDSSDQALLVIAAISVKIKVPE